MSQTNTTPPILEQRRAAGEALARGFLAEALAARPGWVLESREPVSSFQQHLERVRVSWPESGESETLYLRNYTGRMSWWTMETPDLPLREQAAWRAAARAGVPVPETLWTRHTPAESAAIQRHVPGGTLLEAPLTREREAALGRMLARLHAAEPDADDGAHLPDIRLPVLFPRLHQWAAEAEADELAARVRALEARFRGEVAEFPASFLHGDFHGGNVLLDGDTVTAVIDWEEAAHGDPRFDVATMHHTLRRLFRGDGPGIGYLDAGDDFVAAYVEASGTDVGDLSLWTDLCGARSRIVGAWVKDRVARGLPLPTERPQAWF